MSVQTFYNPDLVGQLAACGITARRRSEAGAPVAGFVLEGRRSPRTPRAPATNVIAVHGNVTITGPRQLTERPPALALPAARTPATSTTTAPPSPQTAIEAVEECARLRRDNQRLSSEVARLRDEISRLTTGPAAAPRQRDREPIDLDDSATRFSLLELE